jgi:hypothetical protein
MARFYNINWRGTHMKAYPAGFRIAVFGYAFPYISGSKIPFKVKITKRENESCPRLNQLDIWEVYNSRNQGKKVRKIETLKNYPDNAKIGVLFNESRIAGNDAEYWLGEPGGADSHLLVYANLINYENLFLVIFGIVAGIILKWLFDVAVRLWAG